MEKPVALSAAALLVALVALLHSLLSTTEAPPAAEARRASVSGAPAPRGEAPDDGETAALRARIATLEADVRALKRTLPKAVVSGAVLGGAPRGAGGPDEGAAAPSDAVIEALDEDPAVRERLAGLVGEELRRQEEQRWDERRARFAAAQEQRLSKLADEAGLDDGQREKLSGLLAAEREEVSALLQKARADMSWREARREIREVRRRTDENAAALLEEEQLTHYEAMRNEEPFGRRRGRRGGQDRDRDRE